MDKTAKQAINKKMMLPFVVALIGVAIIIAGMFLPYMTAVGEMAQYIELHPDSIEIEEFDMTASDLKNVPIIFLNRIAASAYSEEEGIIFLVIVMIFALFAALSALFVILRKPIPAMIFDLIGFGVFAFLNFAAKADFLGADKYAWAIGHHIMIAAFVIVFAGAVWMLVNKIIAKKEWKSQNPVQPEA